MSKQPIKVIVEGTVFDSINAAARYLNVHASNVWSAAHGSGKLKDLSIKFEKPEQSQALSLEKGYQVSKHKYKKRGGCPVICETLNKKFKSINAAAKYAKVNDWTMSKKMETAGQFVDNDGNVYKRILPMNTKNVYTNTGDTLKKVHVVKHRRVNKTEVPVSNPIKTESGAKIARDILKGKITEYINNNDFKVAKDLLEVIEQIKE